MFFHHVDFFFFEEALDENLLNEMKVCKLSVLSVTLPPSLYTYQFPDIKPVKTSLTSIHLCVGHELCGRKDAGLTLLTGFCPWLCSF